MKKISVILLVCLAVFASCKNKVKEPESAEFSWYTADQYLANMIDLSKAKANPDTVKLTDVVYFVANTTDATSYVVWPGEAGFSYEGRDLPDSLKGDTVNRVSKKSRGIVLSTLEAGRYVGKYAFSKISPQGEPYIMYGTAKNYDYKTGEFSEIRSQAHPLVVIDDQTDLWGEDPYSQNASDYRMTVAAWSKTQQTWVMPDNGKGAGVNYVVTYEDVDMGIQPGVTLNFKKSDGVDDLESCLFMFKANNCIPVIPGVSEIPTTAVPDCPIYLYTKGSIPMYFWTIDLSKGPVTLTLKSQSAAKDAKSGDPMTKDYFIKAELVE